MIVEHDGLMACDDCVQFIANGELPPDNTPEQDAALEAAIAAHWPGYHLVLAGNEHTDSEFSWRPCDVCGSRLGGNRYPCAALKEEHTLKCEET